MTVLAFVRAAFRQQLGYRVANYAGLFTNVSFLLARRNVHEEGIEGVVRRLYTSS